MPDTVEITKDWTTEAGLRAVVLKINECEKMAQQFKEAQNG